MHRVVKMPPFTQHASLFPALLLVFLPALTRSSLIDQAHVSWQAHSRNDLREWPSLVAKGTTHFKVDAHYRTGALCPSAASPSSAASQSSAAASAGCFLMNHDNPVAGVRYNTTAELLLVLQALGRGVPSGAPPRVTVAVCFKGSSLNMLTTCNPLSSAWRDWLAAATALFDAGAKMNGVAFVVDGDGTPGGGPLLARKCLCNAFGALPSTWQGSGRGDPATALSSDADCDGRFQVGVWERGL